MLQEFKARNAHPMSGGNTSPKLNSRKSYFSTVTTFLFAAFPFIDIFLFRNSFSLFTGPLGYGPFLCMYALLPIFVVRYKFPLKVVIALVVIGIVGSSGVVTGIVAVREYVKVIGSLILPYFYYWYLWQHLSEDVIRGFRIYLKGSVIVSIVGLLLFLDSIVDFGFFEFLSSVLHIGKHPASFGIRIASTLGEPTYFANTIAPAGFFAVCRLFFNDTALAQKLENCGLWLSRKSALLILTALVFTYSSMAFAGFVITAILLLLIKRQIRALIAIPIVTIGLMQLARTVPEINDRIEGLAHASQMANQSVHGSSAILYNHSIITWENFKRNPLVGSGLGSHVVASKKYSVLRGTSFDAISEMNAADASSMFLRIASELGLFGILLTLFFLIRNYFVAENSNLDSMVFKLISAACLITIILQLLRQGNFILNGFPFFVYGYFFARKSWENSKI